MIPAQVVGHVVSSHAHPSILGKTLLLCQQTGDNGIPVGTPFVAVDLFGAGLHSRVFVSTDGLGARHMIHDEFSPIRMFIQGIIDNHNDRAIP